MKIDQHLLYLVGGVLGLLTIASIIGIGLKLKLKDEKHKSFVKNFNSRTIAWWLMVAVFSGAVISGILGSIIMFSIISFLAFREFITTVPTSRSDHRALFWIFFIIIPIQYLLIYYDWYGLFVIFIPVYCFLILPIRVTVAGECKNFLERAAKIQWGLMACVYCVSHAPAILQLNIPGWENQNGKLLFFFVLIVEICDVFQYVWGKSFGKHKIIPSVSPNKTWEGFIGGTLTAAGIGAALWWATPFTPGQAFLLSLGVAFLGFCGDVTMSAIKRDANIKDYGTLIQGHGGILDRIDSLCFAAPIFFHLVRFAIDSTPAGF